MEVLKWTSLVQTQEKIHLGGWVLLGKQLLETFFNNSTVTLESSATSPSLLFFVCFTTVTFGTIYCIFQHEEVFFLMGVVYFSFT